MNLFKLLTIAALLTVTNLVKAQCESPTFDGYTYDVVQIGNQCWFAENLKTTILRDGTPITLITDNGGTDTTLIEESRNNPTGLYRVVLPDTLEGLGLYNSHTYYGRAIQQIGDDVCPTGWRMPTFSDRNILFTENDINDLVQSTEWNNGAISKVVSQDILVNGFLTEDVGNSTYLMSLIADWVGNNSLGFNLIPTGGINGYSTNGSNGGTDQNDWEFRTVILNDVPNPVFGQDYLKKIDWFVELQGTFAATTDNPSAEAWQEGPNHKSVQPIALFWINHQNGIGDPFFNVVFSTWNTNYTTPEDGTNLVTVTGGMPPTNTVYMPVRCMHEIDPVPGCTDELACNYDPEATEDDGSCEYPQEGFSCDCEFLCPGDFNGDGERNIQDLLLILAPYGQTCESIGLGE